jgi:proton-dependent oligopeptide transporter, POT family
MMGVGLLLLLLLLSINRYLLEYNSFNNLLTTTLWIFMAIVIFILAFRQPSKPARNKILAYLLLLCFAIAFWSVALLAPMGLARLVDLNAPHTLLGVNIPNAWFNNLNAIVMIIFGPLLGILFYWLRHRSIRVDISMQFTIGLLFTGIALILLSVGIRATTPDNNISGIWIIICYALQALGTLLIQPIGLAMVGQLAPIGLQGILMGYWMMVLGIASVIATEIAKWIQHSSALLTPSIIDPHYSRAFNLIGWSVISTAMVLILFSPLLLKLIRYRSLDPTLNKH